MPDKTPPATPPALVHDRKRAIGQGITLRGILTKDNQAALLLRADSLGALARYLQTPAGQPKGIYKEHADGGSRKTADKAKEWDLGAGWEGALAYAEQGWPEGRRGLRAAAATLAGEFHPRPPQAWDVAGDWLDIPSAIAGDPEQWAYDEEATGRARIITLAVPLTAPWHVEAETLRNRGAALVSIIDGLEAQGIRCEIEAYSAHEHPANYNQAVIMHRVKEAGAHLSLDRLAASLIHPATFRRLHFAGLENLGDETVPSADGTGTRFAASSLVSGYGSAKELHEDLRLYLDQPGTFHLPLAQSGDFSTPAAAAATIREQMSALGFTFTDAAK